MGAGDGGPLAAVMKQPLPPGSDSLLEEFERQSESFDDVVYLSTPITTGPRLLEWLRDNPLEVAEESNDDTELVRLEVIEDNIGRLTPMRSFVSDLFPDSFLIDPTSLEVPSWRQADYHRFWVEVITRFVHNMVFADGWHLSTGCTIEYVVGLRHDLQLLDSSGQVLGCEDAAQMLADGAQLLQTANRSAAIALQAEAMSRALAQFQPKDQQLRLLSRDYNVASFVSFTPDPPRIRHFAVADGDVSRRVSTAHALDLLLRSSGGSVNVRTFAPGRTKGNPFYYGLTSVDEILDRVNSAAADGFYTIVNETIDVHDGGVSGVSLGGIVEFAPDDTPRAVEKPGAARLPQWIAAGVLGKVYGSSVTVPAEEGCRVEFSLHPQRVGHRKMHSVVWELEPVGEFRLETETVWPNKFSELIGDKAFGLLIAEACGALVPHTRVISRRVAPFEFGQSTKTDEWWLRTAPMQQAPGHFTTIKGWVDPFALLRKEDPEGSIASVLAQESVDARFAGATLPVATGTGNVIEGVMGFGDDFMLGAQAVTPLPDGIAGDVEKVVANLEGALGPVRIEWAHDGEKVWVLQLHRVAGPIAPGQISPGEAREWLPFDPRDGLEVLHETVRAALQGSSGVEVTRLIGITSHVGDILRKAGVPGRFASDAS